VVVLPLQTWSPPVCLAAIGGGCCGQRRQLVDRIFPRRLAAAHLHRRTGADAVQGQHRIRAGCDLFCGRAVPGPARRAAARRQSVLARRRLLDAGLAELFFTLYGHVTDVFNLLGHGLQGRGLCDAVPRAVRGRRGGAPPCPEAEGRRDEISRAARFPDRVCRTGCCWSPASSRPSSAPAATGGRGAFLFFDLDHFKNVNDSLGHVAGDELLQLVARRLRHGLRTGDLLARMGGDEFAVLLERMPEPQVAAGIAHALIESLKDVFVLAGGQDVYIGTSIGICIFPDDSLSVDQIIRNADAALYQAKGDGRGGFRFYTEALTAAANARVEMESALRRGLKRGEFVVHYQPLVAMADCRIAGVEALVRWRPPEAN